MIDELALAGAEHLDPVAVSAYDKKQGNPDPHDDLEQLRAHGVSAAATVLDLGAGTGQFALPASRAFAEVIAVDVSPQMVEVLRERVLVGGFENVVVIEAGFLTFERATPVDAVFTRNALHHLPDFWKALALVRIARLLRPGGVLRLRDLIYDFAPHDAEAALEAWFSRAAAEPATGYTREDLERHVEDEFSTFRWLLEPMLQAAGFEIVSVGYVEHVYGAYTCIRR